MKCPVCDHEQAFGLECDVCGKELGGLGALGPPPVAITPVEGLEATIPGRVGEVLVERLGDLESTRSPDVQVAVQAMPDVEQNRAAPVGEVPVERVELTVDRVPDDGIRVALPSGPITCRYCRNVQATGSLCERCGMRLPLAIIVPQAPGAPKKAEPAHARCRACGAPATAGERCGDCGQQVPFPE
ncbi:MAG: hypothetical protein IT380_18965 [Myxococcales bacterium]|nr:hypothetical protein [Myxococcales bacterium]